MENNEKINLFPISFKSSLSGSYSKAFGQMKDKLRDANFPVPDTQSLIDSSITEKSLKKFNSKFDERALILSMPSKKDTGRPVNILPTVYAATLSKITGNRHIDLDSYLRIRQLSSSRSAYSSEEKAENYFNLGFISKDRERDLGRLIKKEKVVLVDDVLTTGETFVAMSTFLKSKYPATDIVGANALVAVDTRNPTDRDLVRFSKKMEAALPAGTATLGELRQLAGDTLASFTRKKLMRFEINIARPEVALRRYESMKKDVEKMDTSLRESLSGNLLRYPLAPSELKNIFRKQNENLTTNDRARLMNHFHPESVLTTFDNGNVAFFSDPSLKVRLSNNVTDDPQKALNDATKTILDRGLNRDTPQRGNGLS